MTRDGEIKVCDFGIAKRLPTNDRTPSDPGAIYGASLAYAAPEILKRQGWDQRSDIYSLGIVLREVLNLVEDPAMTPRLNRIVCRMLQLKPEHRYQTAAELQNDLIRLQQGLAPLVTSKPKASTNSSAPQKKRALLQGRYCSRFKICAGLRRAGGCLRNLRRLSPGKVSCAQGH